MTNGSGAVLFPMSRVGKYETETSKISAKQDTPRQKKASYQWDGQVLNLIALRKKEGARGGGAVHIVEGAEAGP